MKTILKLMRMPCDIKLTSSLQPKQNFDLRTEIHPKKSFSDDYLFKLTHPYYQVFEDRFGFEPNLSIIDLLFNLGPDTAKYLQDNLLAYKEKFQ